MSDKGEALKRYSVGRDKQGLFLVEERLGPLCYVTDMDAYAMGKVREALEMAAKIAEAEPLPKGYWGRGREGVALNIRAIASKIEKGEVVL